MDIFVLVISNSGDVLETKLAISFPHVHPDLGPFHVALNCTLVIKNICIQFLYSFVNFYFIPLFAQLI